MGSNDLDQAAFSKPIPRPPCGHDLQSSQKHGRRRSLNWSAVIKQDLQALC